VFVPCLQTVGQNYSMKMTSGWFESVAELICLKNALADQNYVHEESKSRLN
jgi:hypothetical protein